MKHIFTIVLTFFSMLSFAQTQSHKPSQKVQQEKASGATFENINLFTTVDQQKASQQVPSELKEYTVFAFNQQKTATFKASAPKTMNLTVPGQKSGMSLELVKVDVTTDDFEIIEMPSGKVVQSDESVLHYRGIIKGQPNSVAAISFFGNEISGIISTGEQSSNLVIGQLKNSTNQIIYEDKDIAHLNDFVCQAPDASGRGYNKEELSSSNKNAAAAAVKCPKIFFDIANDIVRDKGGAQQASNYIEAIFNQVSVLYANDGISIQLSGMKAWTSTAPFNGLNNYRSYRNQNSFNGDLGHFVTYDFSGGVAWVNGLCSSYKYAVSGIRKSFSNVPTYSWSVMVVAHELGHNMGSNHTQACVWNGNNTAIDGCAQTEGNCARPGLPSGGGTIMSYCHLTNVGINLNKGFGPQPRNVILNTISSKSCLETCDGGGGGGGDTYCASNGNNTSDEYIGRVQLGSIDNTSGAGAGGYTDNTSISTNLASAAAANITITPTWTGTKYNEGYAVWIDYNQNNVFTDSGELVWSKTASQTTPVSGTFTVPASAKEGATRMRVAMKYNGVPTSCESFQYGEVEDYTVVIGTTTGPVDADVNFRITFDNYPEETSWEIRNDSNQVVFSGGSYGSQPDGSTINLTRTLDLGCYTLVFKDTYGDGICCRYGNGSYELTTASGSVLASGGSFTSQATTNFCVNAENILSRIQSSNLNTTIETDLNTAGFQIYPSPAENSINVSMKTSGTSKFYILNLLGEIVKEGTFIKTINVEALNAGIYMLKVDNTIKRFVKE